MITKRLKIPQGLSLIEAVVAIVIIGICLSGVLKLMDNILGVATKTLQRRQALLIASSYMEEILARPVADPTNGLICATALGDRTRANFNNVCDYDGLDDIGVHDQDGNPVSGLEHYEVRVFVSQQTTPIPDGYVDAPNKPAYLNLPGINGQWNYLYIGVSVDYLDPVHSGNSLNIALSAARYVIPE